MSTSARPVPAGGMLAFSAICRLIAQHVRPCAAETLALDEATGLVLAEPVAADADVPGYAMALRDGYVVMSERLIGASPLSPLPLDAAAPFIMAGQRLPDGFDAILPSEDVTESGEAIGEANSGGHVLHRGTLARQGEVLADAGTRLTGATMAALRLGGTRSVMVRRPRLAILALGEANGLLAEACRDVLGGLSPYIRCTTMSGALPALQSTLQAVNPDAVITIGGLGAGTDDVARAGLASAGIVLAAEMAVTPGRRAALAMCGKAPVLALPGAPEAVMALTMTLGRLMIARLSGERRGPAPSPRRLKRKIAGPAGLTRLVFVRAEADGIMPLGSERMGLKGLAEAGGIVVVSPQSEGFAEGSEVAILDLNHWPDCE
ncbi:molybdopterin-binding protein [Candidatus Raskinella chloraquaticus]|uniref:Molybdopterin molybdenumtransferase n=1 Tax=Candidatus Raskinella chloraquaticus TaxID=1951219 RepID=A0A1W9HQ45_9HYPH|nr:MAG: hypothetical protein A4S15_02000 [Proteobacteria bacterium SG_bin8]